MYAKQKAIEAQKKKKQVQPAESVVTSTATTQQEASCVQSRDLVKAAMTNRRGKPLILAKKGSHATGGLKMMYLSYKGKEDITGASHGRAKQLDCFCRQLTS